MQGAESSASHDLRMFSVRGFGFSLKRNTSSPSSPVITWPWHIFEVADFGPLPSQDRLFFSSAASAVVSHGPFLSSCVAFFFGLNLQLAQKRECIDSPIESSLLGGSWVVISRFISPLIWVIAIVTLIITPLITTHEPPSRCCRGLVAGRCRSCLGCPELRTLPSASFPGVCLLLPMCVVF